MPDCQGVRDRAVELLDAEIDRQTRSELARMYTITVSVIAAGLAFLGFTVGVFIPATPIWLGVPMMLFTAFVVIVPPIQLKRQRDLIVANHRRQRKARLAIIEA